MDEACFVCGGAIDEDDRLVLVRGKIHEAHCSEFCLGDNLRKRRKAAAAIRRRRFLGALLITGVLAGANTLWHRHRAPQAEWIATGSPEPLVLVGEERPGPIYFGPAWPPTDADWMAAFAEASWIYPLPGPVRREGRIDGRIFGPGANADHPATCRTEGACGVDLGGELWGEHVFAAHDGIVDRVHDSGGDEHGGHFVRLSHFGGMVFTQYFHLAAVPRRVARGAHVKAGDVIGLLGDTGIKGARRHLYFALSVLPSARFSEVYWDPTSLMADWPLRVPPHGTVAGLASVHKEGKVQSRRRSR